jgi:hypothetical protein
MKPTHPPYRSDPTWINEWRRYIQNYLGPIGSYPAPPRHLADRNGGKPACNRCWDTGFCVECLGQYPQYCPAGCDNGYCDCRAGRARRDAYNRSLRDSGLA